MTQMIFLFFIFNRLIRLFHIKLYKIVSSQFLYIKYCRVWFHFIAMMSPLLSFGSRYRLLQNYVCTQGPRVGFGSLGELGCAHTFLCLKKDWWCMILQYISLAHFLIMLFILKLFLRKNKKYFKNIYIFLHSQSLNRLTSHFSQFSFNWFKIWMKY